MSSPLSQILSDLNYDKQNLMRLSPETIQKEFAPYVINRFFKNDINCLYPAHMMNQCRDISKEMVYDFYIHAIPKKKRFIKYIKATKPDDEVKAIMQYYGYNRARAEEVHEMLTDAQVKDIVKVVNPPRSK